MPAAAPITGILVEVKKQATSGQLVVDVSVRLYINGVVSGNNNALAGDWIDTGLTYYSYGGSSDTWGLSLTGADVNNANFGVAFASQKDGGGTQTGNLDAFRITVFYTATATPTTIYNATIRSGVLR